MDEVVVKYYRALVKSGFEHAGQIENPSIFLDSIGENISICASIAKRYIHLFIAIEKDTITDIKYLCMCDPTGNVAVEILCSLVKGKSIENVGAITVDAFFQVVGGESETLRKSADGLLQLMHRGLIRYRTAN